MIDDPEINAIETTYTAIKDLDADAQVRVIKWNISKLSLESHFSISSSTQKKVEEKSQAEKGATHVNADGKDNSPLSSFAHLSELFARAEPKTDVEKALVVGSFLQEVQAQPELTSRLINDELKHLGHGASNITVTLNGLIAKKPNLMIQTRKEGKSKQAQKKYRVTIEGLKFVYEMLNRSSSS